MIVEHGYHRAGLLPIDLICDNCYEYPPSPGNGRRYGGYGHKRLAASDKCLVDCCFVAELVALSGQKASVYQTQLILAAIERASEADDLALALQQSSGAGCPDQTLCDLVLGR